MSTNPRLTQTYQVAATATALHCHRQHASTIQEPMNLTEGLRDKCNVQAIGLGPAGIGDAQRKGQNLKLEVNK